MESHVTDIARVIQLAVAPVFLLTAIATLITALNNRLGRIVDRRRVLTERQHGKADESPAETRLELDLISRRIRLIYFAILSAVLGALSVCLVVASAFIGALVSVDLAKAVAIFFILAMFALISCLFIFLREVFLAVTGGKHIIR
jgi:Protein of unknown function (DUF2721)